MAKHKLDFTPAGLAARQMEEDREKTRRFPHLLARKNERMSLSPLAFLRGAAPLYYEILAARKDLAKGPPGEGWLTGDLHLENFGAYRTHPLREGESDVVFGLNDFDDAFIGPLYWDVLRLTTSILLGAREMRLRGPEAVELGHALIDSYIAAAFGEKKLPPTPRPVALLLEQVHQRTRLAFLESRTEFVHHTRKFIRGPRYESLPAKMVKEAKKAFAGYANMLTEGDHAKAAHLEVVDCALRIAGTGSLGGLRIAVLVKGHGGKDGGYIFDMKEQGTPSSSIIVKSPKLAPAERVVTAIHACAKSPQTLLGTTKLGKISMFVRKLMPQEDKLDFTKLATEDIVPLGHYLGALVGRAHSRGAKKMPKKPWSRSDREHIIAGAIELAAMHEGAYLALANALSEKR